MKREDVTKAHELIEEIDNLNERIKFLNYCMTSKGAFLTIHKLHSNRMETIEEKESVDMVIEARKKVLEDKKQELENQLASL